MSLFFSWVGSRSTKTTAASGARQAQAVGILLIAVGAAGLALWLTGARTASSRDLVLGLFFVGAEV